MSLLELLKQMQVPSSAVVGASLAERVSVLPAECTAYAAADIWGCSQSTAIRRMREAERGGLVKRRPEKDAAGCVVWLKRGKK